MNAWKAILLGGSFCVAPLSVAADLQVIAGAGIAAPLKEIVAQFEKATGHKLAIRYGTTPELIRMATSSPFDLAVEARHQHAGRFEEDAARREVDRFDTGERDGLPARGHL